MNKVDYFLILPGYTEQDMIFDEFHLGTNNMKGTFFKGHAFNTLMKIINNNDENLLNGIKIIDSNKKEHTIFKFINNLEQISVKSYF